MATALRSALAIVLLCGSASLAAAQGTAPVATAAAATKADLHCLPQRSGDLSHFVTEQPVAPRSGPAQMVPVTRGSPRWMHAFNTILAWENEDCSAFATFAEAMGYEAIEFLDTPSGSRHWILYEKGADGARRYNGVFVLRAPGERAHARRLIVTAPHIGFDFSDDRAVRLYRELSASVLLENGAHRCNLETCSGCGSFAGYACGGCTRSSDSSHAVDNLLFALYAALEATRTHEGAQPWNHFEYHGMTERPALASCTAVAQISQGAATKLAPNSDDGSYPNRFWRSLEKKLDPRCVCYHQRENGCLLPGSFSVLGRLVNQESSGPFDPCTQPATRLSGRYIYFEWYAVPVETVIAALSEALPL